MVDKKKKEQLEEQEETGAIETLEERRGTDSVNHIFVFSHFFPLLLTSEECNNGLH